MARSTLPQSSSPFRLVLNCRSVHFTDTEFFRLCRDNEDFLFELSAEGDGAFAVVDVDTLWRDSQNRDFHWKGRACKIYTRVGQEWKLIAHTGLLDYAAGAKPPD